MAESIRVMAVGDLVLDEPNPDFYFAPSTSLIRSADLAIAQIEVPHTTSQEVTSVDVPAPPAAPGHLAAVVRAGFGVATLAGNHIYDCGTAGVMDTVRHCRDNGLQVTGAGANLDEARRPAVTERGGHRIGVLDYNCVGPRESWATSRKAGCSYLQVLTHYELDSANPGGPPSIYTFCEPGSLASLREDVANLRREVDVLVVVLHKGIGHTPAQIAAYEFEAAHAVIDAGADAVVGHHAHILRGIEMYRGAPVFHGLGNFVTVTSALTPANDDSPERRAWAARRRKLFGFEPDPAMPTYAFHPESRNTAVAVIDVEPDGKISAGFIPCWIDDDARPVPLGPDDEGRNVAAYMERITSEAGLDTQFRWEGDLVRVANPGPAAEGHPETPLERHAIR